MKKIGIFGTSGMARDAADAAYELGYAPFFVALNQAELEAWDYQGEVILEKDVTKFSDTSFVIGVGDNNIRKAIALRHANDITFSNLVHPSVTFGFQQRETLKNSIGLIICAGARFTNNISIGNFCIVNQGVLIAHDVTLSDFVNLAPGCILSGNVQVGQGTWVGTGAVINQGSSKKKMQIGENAIIGSGAVVIESCLPNSTYVGVPARRLI